MNGRIKLAESPLSLHTTQMEVTQAQFFVHAGYVFLLYAGYAFHAKTVSFPIKTGCLHHRRALQKRCVRVSEIA